MGILNGVSTMIHGVAPAVGGLIATAAGISVVYVMAIVLCGVAAVPMLLSREKSVAGGKLRPKQAFRRTILTDVIANGLNGFETVAVSLMWPLLVFFIVGSYAGVGALSSVVVLASMLIAFYVGRRESENGAGRYIKRGTVVSFISDVLQVAAQNGLHVFGINVLGGVGTSLYVTAFMTRYYEHSDEESRLEYIFAMKAGNIIGWILLPAIVLLISVIAGVHGTALLVIGLLLAVPANLGIRLMR